MSHVNATENKAEIAEKINEPSESQPNENQSEHGIFHWIEQVWKDNGRIKFVLIALGIFLSFMYVGAFQEVIMRGCYGDEGNKDCPPERKFKHAITLVAVQMLCAFTLIKIMDLVKPEPKDPTHFLYYLCGSLANFCAMASSYTALRYVAYPLQMIFKSAKPIAVMVIGLVVCRRYTIQRYIFVLIIVVGVVIFKLFESKEGKVIKDKTSDTSNWEQITGISLLIFSLAMDGTLGAIQDRIRDAHSTSSRQMMLSMTGYAALIAGTVALFKGELYEVFQFAQIHPKIIWHLVSLGVVASVGQLFIFMMVSSFGSLACSVTTTVRKFFSVVFSIVFFQNPSTWIQWIGAAIVFSALLGDAFFGKRKRITQTNKADIEIAEAGDKLLKTPDNKEIETKTKENESQNSSQNV